MKYLTSEQFRAMLKLRIGVEGTQSAVAGLLNISPQYLSDILQCKREPGPLVAQALGYTKTTMFVKSN